MIEEIIIRKAKLNELPIIAEIFRIETAKKPYIQEWTKKTALEKIKKLFKEEDIFVLLFENKIVGLITIAVNKKKKEIHIDELWIKQEYQHMGIGRRTMEFVEKLYKKEGIKTATLMANQLAGAVKFYERLNYKVKHKFIYFVKKLK